MTKFLNISTDNTLGGSSSADDVVSSQKAIKDYVDGQASNYATAAQGALADTAVQPEYLAAVATSGSYNDLSNKPTIPSMNSSNNYVPYRSSSSAFSNSTLMYNSSAMAFTGKAHIGSTSPANYADKGRLTIYDNQSNTQVSSLALLNYGGGGGCGVAIDMYNTSANGGIPSGRIGVVDNGNYSGYLQLQVKKSGAQSNPLLPAMNVVPIPAPNSTTTCVSFGQDEFNRVLFDLHRTEAYITITDSDKRWSGSGTTYYVSGTEKFTQRLMVAVGDIVYFNAGTEATVISLTSSASQLQITTDVTLGSITSKSLYIKKAYMRISDENGDTKFVLNPYGKMGIGTISPSYDLDVVGTINASTDVKINGSSVALVSQIPTVNNPTITITQGGVTKGSFTLNQASGDTIALDAGSGVSIDEKSITENSSNEIQTVGVIDQNNTSNAIKTWTGTKAQYDAIVSKDANTLYNITDDTDIGLNLLQAIYPVGSVYIGTMATCPLSLLFGTWTLVSSGRVLQGADANHSAGTSISAGLPNITGQISSVAYSTQNQGALLIDSLGSYNQSGSSASLKGSTTIKLNASNSNSIYGNSTTVQPPAYVVNIWERTA